MSETSLPDRFAAWSRVKGLSQAQAAKLVGVSPATLSQVLAGKYAGDVARIQEKMQRALDRAERRAKVPAAPPIVLTSVCEEALDTLRIAHDEGVMAVVMGPSGVGKTSAARLYCEAEPETILVTIRPDGRRGQFGSGRSLLVRLGAALGLNMHANSSAWDLIDQISAALAGTGRLVVIDEVDYCGETPVQWLRMIHDAARVGIVMLATPAWLTRLRSKRSDTVNQFLNRIAYCCHVDGLTDDDAEKILAGYSLDRAALAAAREGAHGVARRLVHGLRGAQRLASADSGKLDARIIARAYSMLMEA